MKIEDFIALLAKLDFEPRRREKLRRNIPTWAFGFEYISPITEIALSISLPRYPARWDGKQYWDGSAVPTDLDPNLVLLLDFEEGSGSIAYDRVVKNRNNGAIYGAVWTTGRVGFGLEFDGVDDYVSVTHHSSQVIDYPTVEAWIYMTGSAGYRMIAGKINSTDTRFYLLRRHSDDRICWSLRSPNDSADLYTSSALATNKWYHIAGTWDGTKQKIYVNGILDGEQTRTFDGIAPEDKDFMIGIHKDLTSWPWSGLIDEVRLYNRALSADEIANHAALDYFNAIGVWG